jgi:pyruvate dehydrogenase (quinone)
MANAMPRFTLVMGDLISLTQLKVPMVVVFNNGTLGWSSFEQIHGLSRPRNQAQHPDFAAIAQAIGVPGMRLPDPADVDRRGTCA